MSLNIPNGWDLEKPEQKAIARTFIFNNFNEAFAFMTRVALYAETVNHHPEWSNVWNRVEIRLTTHDANGLTQKDIDMASWMNGIYNS
jgi:4a-hydroxytetrahydrobiopterin dehydratase